MINHFAISVETIRSVAARTGVREMDVKRVILGLPVHGASEPVVIDALVDAGCSRRFLERLTGATSQTKRTTRKDRTA